MEVLRRASKTHKGMYFYWKQYWRAAATPIGDKHEADDIGHNLSWKHRASSRRISTASSHRRLRTRDSYRTDAPADIHKIIVEPGKKLTVVSRALRGADD